MKRLESEEADVDATYARTTPELVFPPQVPFSWTLRWAHGSEPVRAERHAYRIAGSAESAVELAAVVAFAREHHAKLELG
jgi:hypothetical protein